MPYSARTALGSAHETSLQGLVLPTRRKQRRELVLLFGHWSFLSETVVSRSWLDSSSQQRQQSFTIQR